MLWPRRARVAVGDGAGEQAAEGVVGAAAAVVVAAEVRRRRRGGPSGPPASSCGWRRGVAGEVEQALRVHVELDGVGGRDGEAAQGGAQPGPVGQVLDTVDIVPLARDSGQTSPSASRESPGTEAGSAPWPPSRGP